jgi:uncharacterized glyoxalase superfamily protein PhnB
MTPLRPTGLTPHLFVRDTDATVAFYRTAFGAAELLRNSLPDGRVLFVELAVGPARLLLSEETPSLNARHSSHDRFCVRKKPAQRARLAPSISPDK